MQRHSVPFSATRTMKFLFLAFLLIPLMEIYFLIQVGSVIGAGATIALVVGTALLGAFLVRAQGFATVARVRNQVDRGELPAVEIFEGLFLLVAGALLLTPGFFTDAIGFACLTPPLRRGLIRHILANATLQSHFHAGARSVPPHDRNRSGGQGRVIDVEYHDVKD